MRTLIATKTTNQTRSIADELAFIRSEQHRIATERTISADLVQHVEDELPKERLTREQYESLFDPCGLSLYR